MIRLSRKTDYALVALAYLAQKRGEGTDAVSARKISKLFGLPQPLLMNLLKELTRAGIVTSTRGVHGGYVLTVVPEKVTLKQVVTAIEGPIRITQCCTDQGCTDQGCTDQGCTDPGCTDQPAQDSQACSIAQGCPIREPIRRLNTRLDSFLAQTTLADLIETQVDVPVDCVGTCSGGAVDRVSSRA